MRARMVRACVFFDGGDPLLSELSTDENQDFTVEVSEASKNDTGRMAEDLAA